MSIRTGGDAARRTAQEFEMSERDFDRIRAMIYEQAGITLGEQKREMVYGRVVRRLRALGCADFREYLDALAGDPASQEWAAFINSLTTNLTAFFREPHHFPILAEFARQRRDEPLDVWCCAASTGEEAYSIAIVLAEALGPEHQRPRILATDIDTEVIEQAMTGVYKIQRLAGLDAERQKRFFQRGRGVNAGLARVKPELAKEVEFAVLNLVALDWSALQGRLFDVVFCRNVMIYFDKATQAKVLQRLASVMKPGGLLFAGHSENFGNITRDFVLRGKTVYECARGQA
ncbi:CheR family methyltransferase [Kerstersia gyiorum]|uniref:CheR family methyltransferase n=1 Tax=Kerstersia gyiorum TaxID=206506 RepID=UPI00107153D8|nr:CheR family methyltransferase [Kerstersia gyiorum]QBR39946.1 methyltransferase domain-containing protein [Kerstersia gyiorum]